MSDTPTLIDAIADVELPALWRFSLQLTRDKHDAEDLVQRTCVRAMEQSHQYNDCLLYTSPSPRDGLLSRMPSSA